MKLIKLSFNNSCHDSGTVYLPLEDNLELVDTFEELKPLKITNKIYESI